MNKRPLTLEGTGAGGSGGRRGQSDVLALVVLFGMIFLGAGAVVITGGYLVDNVQGNSEHELAKDSAVQTHESISEALQSGDARTLSVGDGVDARVLDSGSIAIEMTNASGGVCAADGSVDADPVSADMGAIVYDTPKGEVVYQGGAVWEKADGSLSTVRAPPISYDDETTRISIQTVTAEADSFDGEIARPNETMQTRMAEETNRLLTRCPASGYTNVEITVTSPNYADGWERHFDERVDTTDDVTVTRSGDSIVANITNATSAHPSRGLRFTNVSAPTVVGPNGDSPNKNHFDVTTEVVNDGFESREATVELEIDGNTRSTAAFDVDTSGSINRTVPTTGGLHRNSDLNGTFGLNENEAHEYTVRLLDADGEVADSTTGRFFLEDPSGGAVAFFDDSHHFEDEEDTLVVNSTLINTNPNEASDRVVEFQITDDAVDMSDPIPAPADTDDAAIDVPAFGGTKGLSYEIDVSELRAGTYDYVLRHDGVELERTFTINDPPEDSGSIVGDVRVEEIEPSTDYLETGEPFEVRVQLYNTASNETSTDVSLNLVDDALSTTEDVTIAGETRTNVTVELDGEAIAEELATRTEHEYEVTIEDGGDEQSFPGKFVLLESGSSLQIDDHDSTSTEDDWHWINATLANHGIESGDDAATLTIYDDETDTEIGSIETDSIELDAANATTVPFGFNASQLGGEYRYDLSFGEDTQTGSFTYDQSVAGDGNVSITAPGNGSVTVLGTEVSAYNDGYCYWDHGGYFSDPGWECSPSEKSWAPVSVSTVLNVDGTATQQRFENTHADPANYHNESNLNTFDTQTDTYTSDWSQVEGESTTLTVRSTLWEKSTAGYERVNTRDDGDPSTPPVEDHQPDEDILEDPDTVIDASQGVNKEAVRVLEDGDTVPNPQTSGEDQRSAKEILNQGETADRIDDGELDLGPYEAVFLFELTRDSYDGMWDDASSTSGDPDYNDVIVLVSFNPDNPEDISFDVGDHSLQIGPAPDGPEEIDDSGEQSIEFGGSTEGPGTGSNPSTPEPQSPDPGSPSEPDEIDVDVGGVVIG